MSISGLTTERWMTRGQVKIYELQQEGYMTSGDIERIHSISKARVELVIGKPDKYVKSGGNMVRLWWHEKLPSKAELG